MICMLWIATGFQSQPLTAQNINPAMIDFKSIRIDDLSDAQVLQLIKRAESSGMSQQQLESEALRRGMPYSEILKLRERVAKLSSSQPTEEKTTPQERSLFAGEELSQRKDDVEPKDSLPKTRIFGMELFQRENLSFAPSLNVPTPRHYILGAGDQLLVDVWGASQERYELTVSPDGFVRVDNLGNIKVGGLTIEKASELLISRLGSIYSGLRGSQPNTFAQVSLGSIRSIKVTIAGEAYMPGTYTLPALATAFNALYMAGGPNEQGSLRQIRIIRDQQTLATIDLYDFLVHGHAQSNIRLQDEDIILIPPYGQRVVLEGLAKRPAIYELKEGETLDDLLTISGGLTAGAYSQRLKVFRKTDSQHQILDVEKLLFTSFRMRDGDSLFVEPVLDRFENRLSVRGAVFRPGEYAYRPGMRLTDLIQQADGLREDAFLPRVSIYRRMNNLRIEVHAVDMQMILEGKNEDPLLKEEDVVNVSSIFDLEELKHVQILGEVGKPGMYAYKEQITLGELIRKSEGLLESASLARVEVARRITSRESMRPGIQIAEVFSFPLDKNLILEDQAASFVLRPFDIVFVRRSPGYMVQQLVKVEGEVSFPGEYAITRKNEKISDLVKRSGGLTDDAYLPGATLLRKVEETREERQKRLQALQRNELGIEIEQEVEEEWQSIGIDLSKILSNPNTKDNLILMDGDILRIPQQLQTVRVNGALLYPVTVRYQSRMGVRRYVSQAGGFADNAKRNRVYVVYANGSVDRTRNFLVFKTYPGVEPGAEIIVPQKPEKEGRGLQETIAISSAITSMALIVVTIVNQLK